MRTWIVWLIALTWSAAVASSSLFPPDAEVFLTVERGTIVGVGKITGGSVFEIQILQGFSGPARLTLVAPGEVSVFDVVVRGRDPQAPDGDPQLPDGDRQLPSGDLLLPDGTSVFASLRSGGVAVAVVWSEAAVADDRPPGTDGRSSGIDQSNASETGRDNANPRASEGGNPRSGEENPGRRP
ncbi:MAG: hypothetical protein R6T93_04990 [Trueperaceae bacterium]